MTTFVTSTRQSRSIPTAASCPSRVFSLSASLVFPAISSYLLLPFLVLFCLFFSFLSFHDCHLFFQYLETLLRKTASSHEDYLNLERCINKLKGILQKIDVETGRAHSRLLVDELAAQLVLKRGQAESALKILDLQNPEREIIFSGALETYPEGESEGTRIKMFLLDNYLVLTEDKDKRKKTQTTLKLFCDVQKLSSFVLSVFFLNSFFLSSLAYSRGAAGNPGRGRDGKQAGSAGGSGLQATEGDGHAGAAKRVCIPVELADALQVGAQEDGKGDAAVADVGRRPRGWGSEGLHLCAALAQDR